MTDPLTEAGRAQRHRAVGNRPLLRVLVVLTLLSGANYVVWRWLESVNWSVWWIAGTADDGVSLVVNLTWVVFDLVVLSVIAQAARYSGPVIRPEGKH